MGDVFIVEAKRTAIGSFGGSLKGLHSVDLAVPVIRQILSDSNVPADQVDELILGNVFKAGGKGNPARQAAIKAGIAKETPAMTIDKQCASSLRAITLGATEISSGEMDIVVAGGTESMSNVPHLLLNSRWGQKLGDMKTVDGLLYDGLHCAIEDYHMGITAENLVKKYGISRVEQDEFAARSQEKALKAMKENRFADEIIPLTIKQKREESEFKEDEFPKSTSEEILAKLRPAFKKDGTVTAGNASGINDGAAMTILASEQAVKEHNLKPIGRIVTYASAAVDPSIMGIGPVPATQKALKKAGMDISQMDLVELNEAFAAQVLAVNKELGIDEKKINVNGGAIALGHPVGCSGARIVVTLLHEMKKRQQTYGLASLCVGGGQGVSIIVESL
jgi:acetyl-CoA C-acetyltransferase